MKKFVYPWLEYYDLKDTFEIVLGYEDVAKPKPDPEGILRAIETMGGQVEQALMIGDSHVDIQAGKRAGVKTVAYYPVEHQRFYPQGFLSTFAPEYSIQTFQELEQII